MITVTCTGSLILRIALIPSTDMCHATAVSHPNSPRFKCCTGANKYVEVAEQQQVSKDRDDASAAFLSSVLDWNKSVNKGYKKLMNRNHGTGAPVEAGRTVLKVPWVVMVIPLNFRS